MDSAGRDKLGPNPLPYILILIILLPVWIIFINNENSLLYSTALIITAVLKGSLSCHWILCVAPFFIPWVTGIAVVLVLEVAVIHEALQISVIALVFLAVTSTGIWVFLLQCYSSGERRVSHSQVIGIFSRSAKEEYDWLSGELRNVGTVVPFYIGNSNFSEFRTQVSRCSFTILYHSKTRGRVNITDVTDSLYDEEVRYMSQELGREKVLIVVDDLDDSSYGMKSSILQSQRTLRDQTSDLYLFTREEKRDREQIKQKLQPIISSLSRSTSQFFPTARNCKGSGFRNLLAHLVTGFIVAVPWLLFAFYGYYEVLLITSNITGSLLLYYRLCPPSMGPQWAAMFLVVMVELFLVYWYHSGVKAVLLVMQSVSTALYTVYSASSSSSAAS